MKIPLWAWDKEKHKYVVLPSSATRMEPPAKSEENKCSWGHYILSACWTAWVVFGFTVSITGLAGTVLFLCLVAARIVTYIYTTAVWVLS